MERRSETFENEAGMIYKYDGFVVKSDARLNRQRLINVGQVAKLLGKQPDDNVILSHLPDGFRLISTPKCTRYNVYVCPGDHESMSEKNDDATKIARRHIYGDAVFVRRTI